MIHPNARLCVLPRWSVRSNALGVCHHVSTDMSSHVSPGAVPHERVGTRANPSISDHNPRHPCIGIADLQLSTALSYSISASVLFTRIQEERPCPPRRYKSYLTVSIFTLLAVPIKLEFNSGKPHGRHLHHYHSSSSSSCYIFRGRRGSGLPNFKILFKIQRPLTPLIPANNQRDFDTAP